jgi:hypothetical protein
VFSMVPKGWTDSYSSVPSLPPCFNMDRAPPGWSSTNDVRSYTVPLMTIQHEVLELCFETSFQVNILTVTPRLAGEKNGTWGYWLDIVSFMDLVSIDHLFQWHMPGLVSTWEYESPRLQLLN